MSSEPHILFEWSKPQEISEFVAEQFRSRRKFAVPVILLSTAVIELYAYTKCYSLLKSFPDNDIDLNQFSFPFIAVFIISVILVIVLYWLYPKSIKRTLTKYKITDEGISIKNSTTENHKWEKIKAFWLCHLAQFSDFTAVKLHIQIPCVMFLPEESHENIISILNQYIPQIDEPFKYKDIEVSLKHHAYFPLMFIIYYSLFITLIEVFEIPKSTIEICHLLFTLHFGPGTLVLLLFFKGALLKNNSLKYEAVLYNLFAMFLFTLITCLWYFFHLP